MGFWWRGKGVGTKEKKSQLRLMDRSQRDQRERATVRSQSPENEKDESRVSLQ